MVLVRFPAMAPLRAVELLDVVPLEEELSLPLVAALSKVVEPLLLALPSRPAIAALMVVLVLPVLLWVEEWVEAASTVALAFLDDEASFDRECSLLELGVRTNGPWCCYRPSTGCCCWRGRWTGSCHASWKNRPRRRSCYRAKRSWSHPKRP